MEPSGEAAPTRTAVDCGIQIFSLNAAQSLIDCQVSPSPRLWFPCPGRSRYKPEGFCIHFDASSLHVSFLSTVSPAIQHHGLCTIPPQCGQHLRVLGLRNQP